MRQELPLEKLVTQIIQNMKDAQYNAGTINIYERIFLRLQRLAQKREEVDYSPELGQAFIKDSSYSDGEGYCHSRYCLHYRCIQFIESYVKNGLVDWTLQRRLPQYPLKSDEFIVAKDLFEELMSTNGLKTNTKDGYRRLVHYFLLYLEDRGYTALSQIKNGDTVTFITFVCREHYQPTSLNSHLSGLRMFLKMSDLTSCFEAELPERLPKKRAILEVYSNEEYGRIHQYLENSDISLRDKAICLIALETGLRAADICNLKLKDIDWQHDCIHIIQVKTKRTLNIPLKASYGNAIADYLLYQRPASNSENVFLLQKAPFAPLSSHTGCYYILRKAVAAAGVESNGRINGTRITRHSMASRMLRQGIPLPVISEALGHGNPNSVMIYLSTEDAKLAECTLPLPGKGNAYAEF